jgi:hypothetical protein
MLGFRMPMASPRNLPRRRMYRPNSWRRSLRWLSREVANSILPRPNQGIPLASGGKQQRLPQKGSKINSPRGKHPKQATETHPKGRPLKNPSENYEERPKQAHQKSNQREAKPKGPSEIPFS